MRKTLVIAEKPNVAKQLLQSPRFKGMKRFSGSKPYYGYLENEKYILTWARGHLYEVMNPGDHDESLNQFKFDNLPIILPLKYKPIKDSKEQIKIINQLIHRKEVERIYNACDNDKEGELLFREIYEEAKTDKPLYRIWLSSYELGEIEAAFNQLLDGKEFDSLANSARARQYLDHLLGDTISRSCTVKLANNKFLLSGGRVQLCLLNEIRKRELEVDKFVSKTFYQLFIDTGFMTQYQTDEEYILNPKPLEELANKLRGNVVTVKDFVEKESKRRAPNLFNATDFLKACIHQLKMKAPQAKSILQKLYEDGLVSYPRSDSRHLPSSMVNTVHDVIESLGENQEFQGVVEQIDLLNVSLKHRSFDDEKVSSHYAIIPTKKTFPSDKSEMEKKVYDLIVKRFLANWMEPANYKVREVTLEDKEEHLFMAKEKVLIEKGFLSVLQNDLEDESEPVTTSFTLPELSIGTELTVKECTLKTGKTKSPSYHTEASILSFMETAGRNMVEDDEIKELLKGKRIGTAATAESFVPKLIERQYIIDEKGKLRTTSLGAAFIETFPIQELKNPVFTAEMEENITKIEKRELTYEAFREEIIKFAYKIVDGMANITSQIVTDIEVARNKDVEVCTCSCKKGKIVDKGKFYGCTNYPECEVRYPKVVKEKQIVAKQIENLVTKGETDVIKGFKDAEGKTFEAIIFISEGHLKFKKAIFGMCPKCNVGEIRKTKTKENKEFFGCSNYINGCNFSIPSVIKEKKLPEGQVKKLLQQRTTDFIDGFVSKDKEFTARIIIKEDFSLQMLLPTKEDRAIGKCPLCKSNVLVGKSYYLCEQYKQSCDFILNPVLLGKQIPVKQVQKLLEKNLTDTINGFRSEAKNKDFSAKLSYDKENKKLTFVFEQKKKSKR